MTDPADALTEAAKLSILEGRFEALGRGASRVEPAHLVIGVLRNLDPGQVGALGLSDSAIARLCEDLGGGPASAPLSAGDIEYDRACHALVAAAMEATAAPPAPASVVPLHLLLGLHASVGTADPLARQLRDAGLTPARIAAALDRPE